MEGKILYNILIIGVEHQKSKFFHNFCTCIILSIIMASIFGFALCRPYLFCDTIISLSSNNDHSLLLSPMHACNVIFYLHLHLHSHTKTKQCMDRLLKNPQHIHIGTNKYVYNNFKVNMDKFFLFFFSFP